MENKILELTQQELNLLNLLIISEIDEIEKLVKKETNKNDIKSLEFEKETLISVQNKIKEII